MKAALSLGRWTFVAPVGYLNALDFRPSMVADPQKADLVRLAFRRVADGEEVAEVLRQVNALGLCGSRGKSLSLQSFRSLLRNPLYEGRVCVPAWEIDVKGDFEPLIDDATFRRAQLHLRSGRQTPKNHVRDREEFPLRRFLTCAKCSRPISAIWSKGRKGRYANYHCPRCKAVRGRREAVQERFIDHLESMKPNPDYQRLFREIVLHEWGNSRDAAEEIRRAKAHRLVELTEQMQKLEDAHIYRESIDAAVYHRHRDRIQEEIALAELDLHDSRIESIDVKGLLAFAEHLVSNLGSIWIEATLRQRQEIQTALFPCGLPFDGENFGTALTCLMFSNLAVSESKKNSMASPRSNTCFFPQELRRSLRKAA